MLEDERKFSDTDNDTMYNHLIAAYARNKAENRTHEQLKTLYVNTMVNAGMYRRKANGTPNIHAKHFIFINEGSDTLIVGDIEAYKSRDGETLVVIGNPDATSIVDPLTLKDLENDIDSTTGHI